MRFILNMLGEASGFIGSSLELRVQGNSARAWLVAAAVAAGVVLGCLVVRRLLVSRLQRLAAKTASGLDDLILGMLADVRWWLIGATALYVASHGLTLSSLAEKGLKAAFVVGLAVQLLLTSRLAVNYTINTVMSRGKAGEGEADPAIQSASGIIRFIVMLALGSVLLLLVLANLEVEVTPLVTGLGIGGIAVALAAQSILTDLFGSLTILFDKPFLVGDFIIVGDKMGTVENIGVKTTRVRALSGEQLVFSNTDLLSSRIQNFKRMQERRILFALGVVYETPLEKLRQIPQIIREVVTANDQTRFDRAHFKGFGAYSLDFEVVYYVKAPDYNVYMDIQQGINLELVRRFAEMGVEFAYPTHVGIYRPADAPPPRAGGQPSHG